MNKVLHGIRKGDVVCMRGFTKQKLLETHVLHRFQVHSFSDINIDIEKVRACLSSMGWNNRQTVVVFHRCETYISQLAPLIRNRKKGQGVIIITDGTYGRHTNLLNSLCDSYVTVGKFVDTIYSKLSKSIDDKSRFEDVVVCGGIETAIEQLHHMKKRQLDTCDSISDMDIMMYHVPEDIITASVPSMSKGEYHSGREMKLSGPPVAKAPH